MLDPLFLSVDTGVMSSTLYSYVGSNKAIRMLFHATLYLTSPVHTIYHV